MRIAQIPELPGYLSVSRVAQMFGLSKASIYYKIYEQDAFRNVYKISGSADDRRPVLLLLESDVRNVLQREAQQRDVPLRTRLKAWNKRVKQWGRDTGWRNGVTIHAAGQAHRELQVAYLESHPDDARPT